MGDAGRHGHPRPRPGRRRAKKRGGQDAQALGRSRGGFGTKIHVCVDALGLPVRLVLEPGQQNDIAPACDLIDGIAAEYVLADKAYDRHRLYRKVIDQGGDPSCRRAAIASDCMPTTPSSTRGAIASNGSSAASNTSGAS